MVETFVSEARSVRHFASHPSMTAASRELPAGSYTTLRTYGGDRVLRLEQHTRRLAESLGEPRAELPAEAVGAAIAAALARTGHAESRLRLTLAPPRLYVSVEPFRPLPESAYREGVACVTVPVRRENPHAKDTRFIATASEAYAGLPPGVEEGLMLADDGALLEGLSSNFFAIQDGVLRTEDERVLHGVTRALVLEVARTLMPVETRSVAAGALAEIDEAFLTSVSREILPVTRIDGQPVGAGRPGPLTLRLMAAFAELVLSEARPLPPAAP